MNSKFVLIILFLVASSREVMHAQKYISKTARISFYSIAPLENIKAVNKTSGCLIDTQTGEVRFSVLIKSFEFEKALMQEHFNENYLESEKFPVAMFIGKIANSSEINYTKAGKYPVTVNGQLTIHGVTHPLTCEGSINGGNELEVHSAFNILLSDYHIAIPALVKDKVSNQVKITIDANLSVIK